LFELPPHTLEDRQQWQEVLQADVSLRLQGRAPPREALTVSACNIAVGGGAQPRVRRVAFWVVEASRDADNRQRYMCAYKASFRLHSSSYEAGRPIRYLQSWEDAVGWPEGGPLWQGRPRHFTVLRDTVWPALRAFVHLRIRQASAQWQAAAQRLQELPEAGAGLQGGLLGPGGAAAGGIDTPPQSEGSSGERSSQGSF
jgi:hypothetical protein